MCRVRLKNTWELKTLYKNRMGENPKVKFSNRQEPSRHTTGRPQSLRILHKEPPLHKNEVSA